MSQIPSVNMLLIPTITLVAKLIRYFTISVIELTKEKKLPQIDFLDVVLWLKGKVLVNRYDNV